MSATSLISAGLGYRAEVAIIMGRLPEVPELAEITKASRDVIFPTEHSSLSEGLHFADATGKVDAATKLPDEGIVGYSATKLPGPTWPKMHFR